MSDTDPAPPDRGAPASSRRPKKGAHPFFGDQSSQGSRPPADAWWTRSPDEPRPSHPFWGDSTGSGPHPPAPGDAAPPPAFTGQSLPGIDRSEEHTSELQSRENL